MRAVVVGSGVSGLTAARRIVAEGHEVVVLDKGRRPGGRLATKVLANGARADHGAQFITARSPEMRAEVDRWVAGGAAHEWCRGFASADGHPRYAARGGMAALGGWLSADLDVLQSIHVEAVRFDSAPGRWTVRWPARRGQPAGSIEADAVIVTAPPQQARTLVAPDHEVAEVAFEPMLSLLVAIDGPPAVPAPGGVQLTDDPTWSWVGDNVAKGASDLPALTLHTRSDVAARHLEDDPDAVLADLLARAQPWFGSSEVLDAVLHRWRYATSGAPHPDRCVPLADGRLVLAGDAYGGPRVEGAFLSGVAAADLVLASFA